jgi:hypothetical protein
MAQGGPGRLYALGLLEAAFGGSAPRNRCPFARRRPQVFLLRSSPDFLRAVDCNGQRVDGLSATVGRQFICISETVQDVQRGMGYVGKARFHRQGVHATSAETGFDDFSFEHCFTEGDGIKDDSGVLEDGIFVRNCDSSLNQGFR